MWKVHNLEVSRTLTKSGSRRQLVGGGEVLCNGLDSVDWSAYGSQWVVCDECYISGCMPGGEVIVRHIPFFEHNIVIDPDSANFVKPESRYFILPSFSYKLAPNADGEDELFCEHEAPKYLVEKGVFCLSSSAATQLLKVIPHETVLPLTPAEAVRIVQWEAPGHVLGTFPEDLSLRKEMFIGCAAGHTEQNLEKLWSAIRNLDQTKRPCVIRPVRDSEQIISFSIQLEAVVEWTCMVHSETNEFNLLIEPGLVLDSKSAVFEVQGH